MHKPGILIIDDDINLGKTLADILRSNGFDTAVARSGTEGLALFEENKFNLVFIDLGLPDLTGMKVLERIKASRPSTEAIILTGNASLETAIEATNRGAFSYLLKPYEIEQLLLNARRAIEKQQAEEEIVRRSLELQRSNLVLKALHKVSQVLGRTIDMDTLLEEVLKVVTKIEIFRFERKGVAFIVEGGELRLAASIGFSGGDSGPCDHICLGRCPCGTAAATGEITISGNARKDGRHAIGCLDLSSYGHIVLPLKMGDEVVGALCLYTRPGFEAKDWEIKLLATLGSQIGIAVNNARLYREARSDSLRDHLTGLGNRRSLQVQMEKCVEAAKRYGEKLSVIMMDIDHFKEYNDVHGHPEGDRLLVRLAEILVHEMRKTDYVYRYGGEEFLAVLPETDLDEAHEAAERMRKSVEARGGITISLGVASCSPDTPDSASLIRRADAALYRAKQNGRNRVETDS